MSSSEPEGLFLFRGSDVLYLDEGTQRLCVPPGRLSHGVPSDVAVRRRFSMDGSVWEAVSLIQEAATPRGFGAMPFRSALGQFPERELRPATKGLGLLNWLNNAIHCGRCGSPLEDIPEGEEGFGGRRCPACSLSVFPRISPAVIVLVRRGEKALLAHNAQFPAGRFGLIAGFVDPGESLEDTVRRELAEEAGIAVSDIRYCVSQSWPFPDSLMIAFTARWESGEARPDGVEISELRWCSPDDLPAIPPVGSVARRLIDEFVESQGGRRLDRE